MSRVSSDRTAGTHGADWTLAIVTPVVYLTGGETGHSCRVERDRSVKQKYTVNLVTGEQAVWTGDVDTLKTLGEPAAPTVLLDCQAGTLVNLAHVVSLVPVG